MKERGISMRKLKIMDAKNYDDVTGEIYRVAVRAVVVKDGNVLFIQSKYGEIKLPGGGQENDESDIETLIRETLEETGYHIIPASIQEYGEVEEKRRSSEGMLWHQINRYYFCAVEEQQDSCNYTENEMKKGFHQVWYTPQDALHKMEEVLKKAAKEPWNQREYVVLKMMQDEGMV